MHDPNPPPTLGKRRAEELPNWTPRYDLGTPALAAPAELFRELSASVPGDHPPASANEEVFICQNSHIFRAKYTLYFSASTYY